MTIGFALQLERAARLVAQHAVDPSLPGLEEVIDRLTRATFDAPTANAYEAEVRRAEERVLVNRVAWLAAGSGNAQVRAIATLKLNRLATRLRAESGKTEADVAHRALLVADIKRYLEDPSKVRASSLPRRRRRRARRSATCRMIGWRRRRGSNSNGRTARAHMYADKHKHRVKA